MPTLQRVLKALFCVDDVLAQVETVVFDSEADPVSPRAKWVGQAADIVPHLPHCTISCGIVQAPASKLDEVEYALVEAGFKYNSRHTQWVLRAYGLTLCTVEFTPGEDGQVFVQINEDSVPFVDQENAIYGAH